LGRRSREMTARLGTMTMPTFLGVRYDAPTLRVIAALLIFIFLVPYSASVYVGLKYLFAVVLHMSEMQALGLLAALTAIYLVLGGYFAVALTDFIMGLMMIFGVVALLSYLTGDIGGFSNAFRMLSDTRVCSPALTGPQGPIPGWLTLAALVVVTSLGPWGLPQMVQKFYSIKSGEQVKRAMVIATLFALLVTFGGYFGGALTHLTPASDSAQTAGPATYTDKSELPLKMTLDGKPALGPNGKPEVDWDRWVPTYLSERLPEWVLLIVVLLVFSASMSTLSSLVLVSSSAIAIDLYGSGGKPGEQRKGVLVLMRVLCVVFVIVSLVLALRPPSYIITLMVISWGVLAGAFGAPYFYGLFWRRANALGAFAGMVAGVGIGVLLYIKYGVPGVPIAGAVAILLPFAVVPLASMLAPPTRKDVVSKAFTPGA
jgi:solute:Na+ symporter, SSS family